VSDERTIAMATPAEMARLVQDTMLYKAQATVPRTLLLSLTGGGYIALGFVFYVTTQVGAEALPWGVAKLLGGVVFSVGLILVVLTGADLFTSTTMTLMLKASGHLSWWKLLRHWGLVYLGNAAGALTIVALMVLGGVQHSADGAWGQVVLSAASHKLDHSFVEALALGVACNLLVCLAVWAAFSGRTTTDKIMALVGPVALFVATGFEHSVANMFLVPLAIFIQPELAPAGFEHLGWWTFLTANLVPVTLGNIIGGGLMIGLFYWLVFRPKRDAGR